MRITNKRITNNEDNSSPKDPNDDVYYIVYDTDTEEYLTDWDTDQDSGEIEYQQWQEMNFEDEDAVLGNIRKFDTAVLSYSRKSADKLLIDVAADLCDRFPDERINLQVHELTVKIHRTVDVEAVGQVQTFGDEDEDELVDEDEDPPAARPRSGYVDFSNDFYASLAGKSSKKANKVKKHTKGKSRK
jgi:hypothetical protein